MKLLLPFSLALLLIGCGGGTTTEPKPTHTIGSEIKPASFNFISIAANSANAETFLFEWTTAASTSHVTYTICNKDTTKPDNCLPLATTSETSIKFANLPLIRPGDLFIKATNKFGSSFSNEKNIESSQLIAAIGYIKASNTDAEDLFGLSVSLSKDGNTMVVGASNESSDATSVNGDQKNNNTNKSGAVYVFVRNATTWVQQAYIKENYADSHDRFGFSVSLSDDGNTLAIGTRNNLAYIFTRNETSWTQKATIRASNSNIGDNFGLKVSLSGDGNTLAVGARDEDSSSTAINSEQDNNDAENSGAVYVYSRNGDNWPQQAYIKASNTDEYDMFGTEISLSGDGNTLAVGAYDDSDATGINGEQGNMNAENSGAVYVFTRKGENWSQQAYIKAPYIQEYGLFGAMGISLSNDGNTLAISSLKRNINVDIYANIYVFKRINTSWNQQDYIKSNHQHEVTRFYNIPVSLSNDGNTLATSDGKMLRTFTYSKETWTQQKDIFLNDVGGLLSTISLSGNGHTLALGSGSDSSDATGVNGDRDNNNAKGSGAVYIL